MAEGFEKNGSSANGEREEIFSKSVRAGKRTYFFDVKATKGNDHYLTITESKKRFGDDGKFYYEKHKIFLYKEDFEKFSDGLNEAINKIKSISSATNNSTSSNLSEEVTENSFSEVEFDDLGK